MARKKVAICLGLASLLLASSAVAQNPTKYVKWNGPNDKFSEAYTNWTPGQPLYPNAAEDENFFIARVKYRHRFINRATQAVTGINNENEKKVLNWVPIGTADDGNPNALPSGIFDSDVFSMWNMLTHYGNWTAPLVRVPGAFMDAANKNGVTTSALASVPWGVTISAGDGNHGSNIAALYRGGADKFIALLKQYGMSGWGINSEYSASTSFFNNTFTFMGDVYQKAVTDGQWPQYSMVWYTLVTNSGYGVADGLTTGNLRWFHDNGRPTSNFVFGNYNWGANQLVQNRTLAESVGRSSLDVYAGMNLQGAQGRFWRTLKDHPTSIGLWGAHTTNMFFNNRNENGSAPLNQQQTYLTRTERFFSNGNQNPAKAIEVKDGLGISASWLQDFHGVSAFVSAKSVLQWDLDKMPFYSFFNMGNGRFFNVEGKKVSNAEWYNLGMQDYLPTWRYWFATSYLGHTVADNGLKATFTWDDAWFGGSSLEVSGTTSEEYFHLFKTQFALKDGDKIRLRYKVVSGSADLMLSASAKDAETAQMNANLFNASSIELGEWKVAEVTVGNTLTSLRLAGREVAAIALRFRNANNLVLRIGEFSIIRGTVTTPEKPVIDNAKTHAYNYSYKGIDGKIIFNMPKPASFGALDHVYNEDVNTAFFKVYMQQTGQEKVFVTATTSWAALAFSAPFNVEGEKKVKFGVSAVGLDGVTESDIAWSNELNAGSHDISDVITLDKPVIKPGQNFTVGFEDPYHVTATWTITNQAGTEVYSGSGRQITTSIADKGIYNLKATWTANGQVKTEVKAGYIQISDASVGAFPEILTLTFNGDGSTHVTTQQNKINDLAYTGKPADGQASRGVQIEEKPFGALATDLGLDQDMLHKSWSLGYWVKFNAVTGNTILLDYRDPAYTWPYNTWGHMRVVYYPELKLVEVYRRIRLQNGTDYLTQQYRMDITPGAWYHLTYVFTGLDGGALKGNLYINGLPAEPILYKTMSNPDGVQGLDERGLNAQDYRASSLLIIGGPSFQASGINGVVDDVKLFKSALTPEQVRTEMNTGMPTSPGAVGYWDFEGTPIDNEFASVLSGGTSGRLRLGEFVSGSGEGVNNFRRVVAGFDAGSPFVPGTAFAVKTKPTFTFDRGALTNQTGSDTAGSAKVSYAKTGTYSGTLTLTNGWGSVSKTIEVITVQDGGSVEMTDELSLQAFPNPFVESVNVRFANAGDYILGVYDLSGTLVSRELVGAAAGGVVSVDINTPAGLYLLRVTTAEGKLLQTLKIQKK